MNIKQITLMLDSDLLSRIQLAAMMASSDPKSPMPIQDFIRVALDKAFPIKANKVKQ